MRALTSFGSNGGKLIDGFSAGLAEQIAVRRAEFAARAARAEAELSIRARSEFLANMNHELRTPLNAIIGFSTMLKESDAYHLGEEQRRAYAEYVIQSADLLLGHIDTILETAALDSGSVAMAKADVGLGGVLKQAVERARVAATAAGVAVEDKTQGEGGAASADALRLGQALDHLLRAAIKASPSGARVLVRAGLSASGAPEIAVRDHGSGYDAPTLKRALSAFNEVHRGLDRSFAGPGVGLAIAKTFVEMQGGRFDIKSKEGEGTVIRVVLSPPVGAATAARTAASSAAEPRRQAS
jgi:two-component system cell cycle sensor histidine kinase PleC